MFNLNLMIIKFRTQSGNFKVVAATPLKKKNFFKGVVEFECIVYETPHQSRFVRSIFSHLFLFHVRQNPATSHVSERQSNSFRIFLISHSNFSKGHFFFYPSKRFNNPNAIVLRFGCADRGKAK